MYIIFKVQNVIQVNVYRNHSQNMSLKSLHEMCLHCALAATQCIVIAPVCLWLAGCGCVCVCYHDNSKLRASILTKLGL